MRKGCKKTEEKDKQKKCCLQNACDKIIRSDKSSFWSAVKKGARVKKGNIVFITFLYHADWHVTRKCSSPFVGRTKTTVIYAHCMHVCVCVSVCVWFAYQKISLEPNKEKWLQIRNDKSVPNQATTAKVLSVSFSLMSIAQAARLYKKFNKIRYKQVNWDRESHVMSIKSHKMKGMRSYAVDGNENTFVLFSLSLV